MACGWIGWALADNGEGGASGLLAGFGPGRKVAGYLLEEQIGAGGMAVVFRALDERLCRRVALKLLVPTLAADEAFRKRFIGESRAAATVDDPHIIPVHEAGEADGVLYIAMRLVPGRDVRTLLSQEGPLPTWRATAIISPVAAALDAAHAAGLVHRDVKPANMLIDARPDRPDHVYLSDFGLSKAALASTGLTASGVVMGTPSYIAPEQIQGRAVDGRADQYALACAAFEILSGEPPFQRDHGMAVIWAHLSDPPPSLSARRAGLPRAVDGVLAKALAKDPSQRFRNCSEFAEALRAALTLTPYKPGAQAARVPSQPPAPAWSPTQISDGRPRGDSQAPTQTAARSGIPASGHSPVSARRDTASGQAREPGDETAHDEIKTTAVANVTAVTFGPGGSTLAVADSRGNTRLYDVTTARLVADLTPHLADHGRPSGVEALASSPDGSMLAVAGADGTTRIWSHRGGGRLTHALANPRSDGVNAIAFSADGSLLAAGDNNGSICLWHASTGAQSGTLRHPASAEILSAAFNADGSVLAAGDSHGAIHLWDTSQSGLAATLGTGSAREIFSLAFTQDGSLLASSSGDGSIYLWNPAQAELLSILTRPHLGDVKAFTIAFSPDSARHLAAGYSVGGVGLWDPYRARLTRTLGQHDPPVLAIAYSPDGHSLATGHAGGTAKLWNLTARSKATITISTSSEDAVVAHQQ